MGTSILGRQQATIFVGFLALFPLSSLVWHLAVAPLLSFYPALALVGICSLLTFFLLVVRLLLPRTFWLSLWLLLSPVFLCSLFVIPAVPVSSFLPLLLAASLLLGLWGWYRFYPCLRETQLHQERFARLDEVSHLLSLNPPADGLLMGTHKYTGRFVGVRPLPTRRELGNMLVVAPTRGGKGLLAISQLLSWRHSVVVNDLKGDLFDQTAGYRATIGDVYVIDPIRGVGHRFDPLQGKKTEQELYSAATHLLFEADEKERIFTQRAIVMLTQLFLAARIEGIAPFPYIRFLIRLGLEDAAARLYTVDPELATQFLDRNFLKANWTDKFLLSSWSTLTTRLRPLLTETVVRCLNGSDFTPGMLMQSDWPVTVYIRWKEQDLLALSPLVRLLWGSLIYELIGVYDNVQGRGCQPVLLLVDEASKTAIPSLSEHAATVAGRDITIAMFVQSLTQLETIYGRARAQTLRDNMDTQLFYPPRDQATAKYLEDCLGSYSAFAHSTTTRSGAEASEGLTERPLPLLTAQKIRQLKDVEVIGFHRNLHPIRMKRMDWRAHPILRNRQTMPAPKLPQLPQLSSITIRPLEEETHTCIDPDMLHEDLEQGEDRLN
jgi:type IV secretion system protein VirD4